MEKRFGRDIKGTKELSKIRRLESKDKLLKSKC